MRIATPFALAALATAGLAFLVGCPGALSDPERFDDAGTESVADAAVAVDAVDAAATCPDVPEAVFKPNCATSGCHAADSQAGGLDLASPNLYARLLAMKVVDATTASSSLLYLKLTPSPPTGSRMPLGGKPLDDATLACVLTWISSSSTMSTADAAAD